MNKFSNILKIPPTFDLYKEMVNKIALKLKSYEPSLDVPMFGTSERKIEDVMVVDHPQNFAIAAIYDQTNFSIKSLNEISDYDEKFVLHLNVLHISPQTVYDSALLLCSNCHMRYNIY